MPNAIFSVNNSRIYQGPGRGFYNWFPPAANTPTLIDGSTPPQLLAPTSQPAFQTSYAYNLDDCFVDPNGNMQRVVGTPVSGVTTSQSTAPTFSTGLFGLTTDTSGITYMNLGVPGVSLGANDGAMEVDIADATVDRGSDQYRAPLDSIAIGIKASISITLNQLEADLIARSLAAGNYTTGTNSQLPTGAQSYSMVTGGGMNSRLVPKVCVVAVLQKPGYSGPSKSHVITLYGATIDASGLKTQAELKKHSTNKIKFDGKTVMSRPDGDQVYQWVEQL